MQNQFRVGSLWRGLACAEPEFGGEVVAAIDSGGSDYPNSPLETRRLIFGLRFVRGPKHCVAQTNGTLQPARLGIGTKIGEKIHKRLQKRPLYRRTIPLVDADDAAQSACLSIRAFCNAHNEKEWQCRQLFPKKRHLHSARACALKRSSPVKRIPLLNAAWLELYCTVGLLLRQPRRVPEIFRAIGMWVSEITQGRG